MITEHLRLRKFYGPEQIAHSYIACPISGRFEIEEGVTVILTTHYIEEAEEMADRVGVIRGGELIAGLSYVVRQYVTSCGRIPIAAVGGVDDHLEGVLHRVVARELDEPGAAALAERFTGTEQLRPVSLQAG